MHSSTHDGQCHEPAPCSCGTDFSDCDDKLIETFDVVFDTWNTNIMAESYDIRVCEDPSTIESMGCGTAEEWLLLVTAGVQQCCVGYRNAHWTWNNEERSGTPPGTWVANCQANAAVTCSAQCASALSYYAYRCASFDANRIDMGVMTPEYADGIHETLLTFAASTCGGGSYDEASQIASGGNPNTLIVPANQVYAVQRALVGPGGQWDVYSGDSSTNECVNRLLRTGSSTGKTMGGCCSCCSCRSWCSCCSCCCSAPPHAVAPPFPSNPPPLPSAVFCIVIKQLAALRVQGAT